MTAVTPADAPAKFVHRLVDRKAFTRAQVILFLPNVVMLCAFVFCHLYRFQAAHLLHPATIAMTNNYLLTGLAGMYAYGVQWPLLAALLHSSSAAMQANSADIKASSNIGEQAARHSPYETALHNVKLIGPEWVQTLLWIISHLLVAPFTWWNIMVSFTVGPAHLQLCRSVAIGTIRREFDNGVSQYVRSFINRFIPGLLFCMFLFSYGLMTAFSYTALVSNAQGGQLAEVDFSVLPEVSFCAQNINEVSARGCRSAALQPLQSTAGRRTRSSAACNGHLPAPHAPAQRVAAHGTLPLPVCGSRSRTSLSSALTPSRSSAGGSRTCAGRRATTADGPTSIGRSTTRARAGSSTTGWPRRCSTESSPRFRRTECCSATRSSWASSRTWRTRLWPTCTRWQVVGSCWLPSAPTRLWWFASRSRSRGC